MLTFLRFVGLLNASVWLGAAVFFTFFAGPALFSTEALRILPRPFAGAVALIIIKRYFLLYTICGGVALAHLVVGWLYAARPVQKWHLYLLIGMFSASLLAGFWLVPQMQAWHYIMYSGHYPAAQIVIARRAFNIWHGVSQTVNLLMLAGLVGHLVRTERDNQVSHFISSSKFRG